MTTEFFKVDPQGEVGKTEVLFSGEKSDLRQVKKAFKNIKSSEIYPSMDQNFKYSMFFYETKSAFVMRLQDKCETAIANSSLDQQAGGSSSPIVSMAIKIGIVLFAGLLLYFIYQFFLFAFTISNTVQ